MIWVWPSSRTYRLECVIPFVGALLYLIEWVMLQYLCYTTYRFSSTLRRVAPKKSHKKWKKSKRRGGRGVSTKNQKVHNSKCRLLSNWQNMALVLIIYGNILVRYRENLLYFFIWPKLTILPHFQPRLTLLSTEGVCEQYYRPST